MAFKRPLLWIGTGLLAYCALSLGASRWAWVAREKCSLPCKDMGDEVLEPPSHKGDPPIYRPACSPLRLELELYKPAARRNTRYTLWYRARLINESCFNLHPIDSTWMKYSLEELGRTTFPDLGFSFLVTDPAGREVPQGGFSQSKDYAFLYPVIRDRLQSAQAFDDRRNRRLIPGEAIETVPTELAPYAEEIRIDPLARGHIKALVPLHKPKGAEDAPAGFRILDAYGFSKKGTHRIRAVYRDDVSARNHFVEPRRLPPWLTFPADILSRYGVSAIDKEDFEYRFYRIEATSPELTFTVE